MICVACKVRHHEDCPGGNWCDCQHLPAAGAGDGDGAAPEGSAEPAVNWIHQG
jgi:hypothetical protein